MFGNVRGLRDSISVKLPVDENGLTSRRCPNADCKSIFKVKFGTGLKGTNLPCHCPYCGHISEQSDFNTPEQIEYAKSVAIQQITSAIQRDLEAWGRELERSTRNGIISMSVDVTGHIHPIHYYQEKQLETQIICENCTLVYAIYGVFAFCPDCGVHNSLQILEKNLELVEKELALSLSGENKELEQILIDDALENAVSAFDGFGRATCVAFASKAVDPDKAKEISFQNISGARQRVQGTFNFDIAAIIDNTQWELIIRCFQKRHLLAHTMGVVDEEYITKANDSSAIVGRKIVIRSDEVKDLVKLLAIVGKNFHHNLSK
jgi:hypothetical protein